MKNLLCLVIGLFIPLASSGQTVTQLKAQLQAVQHDTTRFRLYCELASQFRKQGKIDSLYSVVQKVQHLAQQLQSATYKGRFFTHLGHYYRLRHQFDQAIKYFQLAIGFLDQDQDRPYRAEAMQYLMVTYADKTDQKQAIKQALENINFYERNHFERHLIGTYSLLTAIYNDLKNRPLQLYYRNKYNQLASQSPDLQVRIGALDNQALGYEEERKFSPALAYRQKEVMYARRLKVPSVLVYSLRDLAANLRQQGRVAEALPYIQEAVRHSVERDSSQLALSLRELATNYLQAGRHKQALQAAQRAVGIVRKDKVNGSLLDVLNTLALVQQSTGHYREALGTTHQIMVQKDSLFNVDKHKAIAQLQATHDLDTKEHTIQLLHKDVQLRGFQTTEQNRKMGQLMAGLGMLMGLVGLIGILLHRANRTRQQLAHQNHLIESQAQELQEANRSKDQLFSIVGHDLRAPITGLGYLLKEVEQTDPQTQNWPSLLSQLTNRVSHLGRLVNNLLYWSLAQQGLLQERAEWLDLDELVTGCLALLGDIIHHKGLQVEVSGLAGVQVWADERHLQLIMRNLLDNAVKFSPNEGHIIIDCSEESESLRLTITNQTSSQPGTGVGTNLGLKTVRELVERHTGSLTLEQPQDQRWRVSLSWPVPQSATHPVKYGAPLV